MNAQLLAASRKMLDAMPWSSDYSDEQDPKAVATRELLLQVELAEARQARQKLAALNRKVARGLASGALTADGKPSREVAR